MKRKHSTRGAFGRARTCKSAQPCGAPIPYEIKTDIAKVVRSLALNAQGGQCFFRAVIGFTTLQMLGFRQARPCLGGMVYRAGPDEVRDVMAFCGPNNQGCMYEGRFLGHYWIADRNDFIDFSVGDWRENARMSESEWHQNIEQQLHGYSLGAVQWTAPELAGLLLG
jgi:hypothetical protein